MQVQSIVANRRNAWGRCAIFLVLSFLIFLWWSFTKDPTDQYREDRVWEHLSVLTEAPHPFGSRRQRTLAKWLQGQVPRVWHSEIHTFIAKTPNPRALDTRTASVTLEKKGYNVIATQQGHQSCWLFIGSHYDTKNVEGVDYLGANDSASTTALLLEIAQQPIAASGCGVALIWFDGEEPVLEKWNDGELHHPARQKDHTYGSRAFLREKTQHCGQRICFQNQPIQALILLDMLGSPGLTVTRDLSSTPYLVEKMVEHAKHLGIRVGVRALVEDDHIPFLQKGVPAVNIIDFHNTQYWHRYGDDLRNVSKESLYHGFQLGRAMMLDVKMLSAISSF